MNYEIYKKVRNASWQCLIDCNVNSLPTKLSNICEHFDISIVKNSDLKTHQLRDNERGKTVIFQNKFVIIIRDTDPIPIQRYTISHEIGHILMGKSVTENEAERFAIGILAPACVLWGLKIHEPEDIVKLCNISLTAAQIRAERMELLYKREQEFLNKKSLNFELCKYLHPTQFTNNRLCHYIYKNVKIKTKMNANAVLTFTFL